MNDHLHKTHRIIVVDPDKGFGDTVMAVIRLSSDGEFDLDLSPGLDTAIATLAGSSYDAVILGDALLGGRSLEGVKRLHAQFPKLPVIVCARQYDEELAGRAVRQGVQCWLTVEDLNLRPMMRVLRQAIERQQGEDDTMARLRELNETKSQFVTEASHELRTPLSIIREFMSLLNDEIAGPVNEEQKKLLGSGLQSCDRMTRLIDKMLDLAKVEAGKAGVSREEMDLVPLLHVCENDFESTCRSKGLDMKVQIQGEIPHVFCDADSIHNVLANLIDNAIKFTDAGGHIVVGARKDGRFVTTFVEDSGRGIPTEAHGRIFEAFAKFDTHYGPGEKGTGLGLTIAKQLVELNGGVISLESEPGKGSRFSLMLPIHETEPAKRVLVVDDDPNAVATITGYLAKSDLNLDVKSTTNALESLIIAGQFNPNLVILDVNLAEIGGEMVLKSLKEKMAGNVGKVLMISGNQDALKNVRELGADDSLVKPFSRSELVWKMSRLLGIETRKR